MQGNFTNHHSTPAIDRFMGYVEKQPNGCWYWTASLNIHGYGQFYPKKHHLIGAHCWSYEYFKKEKIPKGMCIDHICHVPDVCVESGRNCLHRRCVNPDHLEIATDVHNKSKDRSNAGRAQRIRTHCPQGHPYSGDNLVVYNVTQENGNVTKNRQCRACNKMRNHAKNLARKNKALRENWHVA